MSAPNATAKMKSGKTLRQQKNAKKQTTKNVLLNPYTAKWPVLSVTSCEEIKTEIIRVFQEINLHYPNGKGRRDKTKREQIYKQMTDKQKEARKQIMFGVNAVTRAVERNQLDLVLVNRDAKPALLIAHLIPLCVTRRCPAAALPDLSTALRAQLMISSITAVGFRKPSAECEKPYKDLVTYIKQRCLPIDLPWLGNGDQSDDSVVHSFEKRASSKLIDDPMINPQKDSSSLKKESLEETVNHSTEMDLSKSECASIKSNEALKDTPSEEEDFSYLYIYKGDKTKGFDSNQNFISFGSIKSEESDSNDDKVVTLSADDKLFTDERGKSENTDIAGKKRKRDGETNQKVKKKKKFNKFVKFEECNVKKLQSNMNRRKKSKHKLKQR